MSSTSSRASNISCCWLRDEFIPCRRRTMWPFAAAFDGGKCFVMTLASKPGKDLSWLLLMALIMVDTGGDPRDWW